jgi:hypothetical protein
VRDKESLAGRDAQNESLVPAAIVVIGQHAFDDASSLNLGAARLVTQLSLG